MAKYRKLGRRSDQRKALIRNQVTALLYNGKIVTTEARAKEVRKFAEGIIASAVKEADNFEEVTVKAKVARKDKDGKRVKEVVDGKKKTVYDVVDKTIKKDMPSRLHARRQMLKVLYPVVETGAKKRDTKKVDLVDKLFTEIAPKYKDRNGGYTRIVKIGPRKGDGAMQVVLEDLDFVSIIATPKNSALFFKKIGVHTHQVKSALIVGGGTLGYYLAALLSDMKIRVSLLEINRERCEEISELLPAVTVICGDGTDKKLLMEEGLVRTESFVTLTNMDEENILLSLFAKKISQAKIVTKVNRIAFDDIVDGLDLGSVVHPKYITADYILQYVRAMGASLSSNVETLYHILDGQAEALEFAVKEDSAVTGIPLSDLRLKNNLLVASINRGGVIHIPRGQDIIQPGDTVIIVTTVKGLNDLTDILAGR